MRHGYSSLRICNIFRLNQIKFGECLTWSWLFEVWVIKKYFTILVSSIRSDVESTFLLLTWPLSNMKVQSTFERVQFFDLQFFIKAKPLLVVLPKLQYKKCLIFWNIKSPLTTPWSGLSVPRGITLSHIHTHTRNVCTWEGTIRLIDEIPFSVSIEPASTSFPPQFCQKLCKRSEKQKEQNASSSPTRKISPKKNSSLYAIILF